METQILSSTTKENKILFDITKEHVNIIEFNKQQDNDVHKLEMEIKQNYKNLTITIEKKCYYDKELYTSFYFHFVNKFFILFHLIKEKNLLEKMNQNLVFTLDIFNKYEKYQKEKTDFVLNIMSSFNELYLNVKNNDNQKDLFIDDLFLFYEINNKVIHYYIFLLLHLKNSNDKDIEIKEFNLYFNHIKNVFQNTIRKTEYFKEFLENSKYFYMLYFKYYLQKKFSCLDPYPNSQLSKWNTEHYEFDDITIIYLYFHYRRIYIEFDVGEIEFELNKIENLYQKCIE
jgi:hypothetical protein